ncbi:MAG: insulinase family protein, partial [Chloroflexota bacterium]|nr:insulinase family protein [Chloroflexota bacterium]
MSSAPIASIWTWYRVGSRNERPGLTGASHWVEHMQFKGTPSLAKGQIFRDVARHGGKLNAMTSLDWTAYYETLPVDRLELALSVESDRMINSLFDANEVDSERTVILSELHGAENRPQHRLNVAVLRAAFAAHPYRNLVIGNEEDLMRMTRDDLYRHYRQFYQPDNAFITAVGGFDAEDLFHRIDEHLGQIEPGPGLPLPAVAESGQSQERSLTLQHPAPTSYLRMAFHVPNARHPDLASLFILDAVLSGGKGMGLRGGQAMGRASRLYRALVETGLARSASSSLSVTIDPYLFVISVTAISSSAASRIDEVLENEIQRLQTERVSEIELERAKKQVRAQYLYSLEGVTNQAFWLGHMEIVDRYGRADSLISEIDAVTADDLLRVSQFYFQARGRTVGWLHPDEMGTNTNPRRRAGRAGRAEKIIPDESTLNEVAETKIKPASATTAGAFERSVLPNGIVVLGQTRPDQQSLLLRLRLEAGAMLDPLNLLGRAAFTARMLTRGTESFTFQQLNEQLDSLGAVLTAHAGRRFTEITLRCLQDDLDRMLGFVAEIIRRPTFPGSEAEIVRQQMLSAIREQDTDTGTMADLVARRLVYPPLHPYGQRVIGELETIPRLSAADLGTFRFDAFGPNLATIAIVGGMPSFEAAFDLIAKHLGDWASTAAKSPDAPPPVPLSESTRSELAIPGKSQADIALAVPTIRRGDPGFYALDTANLILGRLGLMGRLGASVRDNAGLAYYVYSQLEPGRQASLWLARAGVSLDQIDPAIEAITKELRSIATIKVAQDELDDAKSHLTGSMPLALES